jgi:1,4-dihydroxy-2-naphthoyl-CoA hydrolase
VTVVAMPTAARPRGRYPSQPLSPRVHAMPIWNKPIDVEGANRFGGGSMLETLGIRFLEFGDDFLRASMPVDAHTRQPFGQLHGGASVTLAETLGSFGGWLCLPPGGGNAVGIEINANHLRTVRDGEVVGTARPLHLGRSTQVWEIRIVDPQDRLVCISRLTLAVVPESAPS